MIPHENVEAGYYWATFGKGKEKVMAIVYGQSPFLRIDVWIPSFGKTGMHVDNVNIETKPIEFIEEIKGLK